MDPKIKRERIASDERRPGITGWDISVQRRGLIIAGVILLSSIMAAKQASAGPSLGVGNASGQAGTTVTLPVTFNPSTASVASLQFSLTLPPGLSTGTVTAGAIVTAAGKSVSANLAGNTWTFIIFGLNQTAIGGGTLLTAQLNILPGTAAGSLSVGVSNVVYSDPNGSPIAGSPSTGGAITVLSSTPPPPVITSAGTATGTLGGAFSYQITASNSPTTFNATGLPAGLSVNASNGLISGTPTASGSSSVTLSATNAGGTGTATLALTISNTAPPPPVITSALTATGAVGSAFSYQITASNSPTSFNAVGLPAGLLLNASNGSIYGAPTAAGSSSVTLSATNAGGTGSNTLILTINSVTPPKGTSLAVGSASGQVGAVVTLPVTFNPSTASVASLQFSLTLPPGLSTGTVTPGAILTAAGKSVSSNLTGNTWIFIAFGLNQTAISSGTLLTAQLNILPGAAVGPLSVGISNTVYSDPNGSLVAGSPSTGGVITVIPSSDITPPTVAILSPANNATVSSTITVVGTAADNVAVSNVQISVDGGAYSPATGTGSWAYTLYTASLSNGNHTVTAKAMDTSGNTATASVMIVVANLSGGGPDATPKLNSVLAYPNPAVRQDPVIRAMVGVVNSVEITIFDGAGRVVHSDSVSGAPTGIVNGLYYYDYAWTGHKASGVYFAVIHAKTPDGSVIRARTKLAVVN